MAIQVFYLAVFFLLLAVDIFEKFWMGSFWKKTQLILEFLKGIFLSLLFSLLYINDVSDDAISNIAIYADDIIIYSKCNQVIDLLQQLELSSELESSLWTL